MTPHSPEGVELPVVSVVIPAYNHAEYLDAAIQSVLKQDYRRVELIVIDDGSTDSSREVLKRYAGKFHIESQVNVGQAQTLNKGWQMARGEILGYLSADDFLLDGAISAAVDLLRARPEVVLSYCDFNLVDEASRTIRKISSPEFDFYNMAVKFECAPGPGSFFRRAAYLSAGGWDPTLRQIPDYEFWLRLARQGPFKRIPRVLAAWRKHETAQSFVAGDKSMADEPIRAVTSFFRASGLPSDIAAAKTRAISCAYMFSARLDVIAGRYTRALGKLATAIAIFPAILWSSTTRELVYDPIVKRLRGAFGRATGGAG